MLLNDQNNSDIGIERKPSNETGYDTTMLEKKKIFSKLFVPDLAECIALIQSSRFALYNEYSFVLHNFLSRTVQGIGTRL